MDSLTQGLNLPPEKPKSGEKSTLKKAQGSQTGLAVSAVVMLALAAVLLAWQMGVFEPARSGGGSSGGADEPVLTYHPATPNSGGAGGAPAVTGSAAAAAGDGGAGDQKKPDAPKAHEQPGRAPISPGRPGQFEVLR